MSRAYSMSVTIDGAKPERIEAIKKAASEEWSFEGWLFDEAQLTASGESTLCGGEGKEQFTERLSRAIWRANAGFCDVDVAATYLEDLPCEHHSLDENDYRRMVEGPVLKNPRNLSHEDLAEIVTAVVRLLYGIEHEDGSWTYAADREWSGADVCQDLAGLLTSFNLVPESAGDGEPMQTARDEADEPQS